MPNFTGPVFIISWLGTTTVVGERHMGLILNLVALGLLWALANLNNWRPKS